MKRFTIYLLISILTLMVMTTRSNYAQDIIYKFDGTKIEAIILQISSSKISYNKYDMQDGPIYSVLLSEVSKIIYEDGLIENYTNPSKSPRDKHVQKKEPKIIKAKTSGQNEFYIDIKTAFCLPLARGIMPDYLENYTYSDGGSASQTTVEVVKFSLGKGINFGGSFGYMFSNYIGADLGVSYLLGFKNKAIETSNSGTDEYSLSSKMIRFIPSLVLSTGSENVNVYAKLGVIIGKGSILYTMDESTSSRELKYKGGIALGGNVTFGLIIPSNSNTSFFCELNLVSLSYSPKKSELVLYTENGTDLLPVLTVSEKQTNYVDKYTYYSGTSTPDSEPSIALKKSFPFSSIDIVIGVRIGLK